MYNDYDFGAVTYATQGNAFNWIISFLLGIWFIILAFSLFMIIAQWKIFKKAGKEGWEAIIPIYNTWVLFEISGLKGWYSLLAFIPFVGPIIFFVFSIISCIKLSKCFGKDPAFSIGLIFIPIIFYPILAFDKSTYTKSEGTIKIEL